MRRAAILVLGLGLPTLAAPAEADYYCGVGFEPAARGRCIATAARDEIELTLDDAVGPVAASPPVHHRRRHRTPPMR